MGYSTLQFRSDPETTIRFDLPQSQENERAIYNLAAQRVATLVQGHREGGAYSVRWDGVTDAGLKLASGVYFYRLTAGEFFFPLSMDRGRDGFIYVADVGNRRI